MSTLLILLAFAGGVSSAPPVGPVDLTVPVDITVPVDVTAPPECTELRSLNAELESCLSVVPDNTRAVVLLTSHSPGFTAHIELHLDGQNIGTRVIELPRGTCADALRAVALAICIALDSAGAPWTPPYSAAREPEVPQRQARSSRDVVFGPAVSWRPPPVSFDVEAPTRVRLQLGAALAIGLIPAAALGVTAGTAVGWADWNVELALTYLPAARFEGPSLGAATSTSLDVSWTGATATGTWRRGPWVVGAWLMAGAHAARQRGFEGDSDAPVSPYVAVGGRVGLDVPLLRDAHPDIVPLYLSVHVDVGGALLRGRYVVETERGLSAVWVPPSVPVFIGLSLSAEIF